MSYDPSISHSRRSHAPNRLYLELSISQMCRNYLESGGKGSYDIYRRQLNVKNIAFTKLGQEECEMCLEFENHSCSIDEDVSEEILSGIINEIECNLNQKTNVSNNVKKRQGIWSKLWCL